MIKRALVAIVIYFAATALAGATGSIECLSNDGALVNIQVSNLATTTVSGIEITTEKRQLSTWEDRGEPIVILQHFIEDNRVLIDVSDPNVERIVAQIRLFFATEDNEQALAGTMRIEGTGVFALSCEGP